ncbi:MAG: tetratricopeptide repeat protein [Desulfonauticus sp.]|nr:tetratricopeptide repeat protein [Desulfonauticus sp.]
MSIFPEPCPLTKEDVLIFQSILKGHLSKVIKFSEFLLFFPLTKPDFFKKQDVFVEQDRISIALNYKNNFLGMIVLKDYKKTSIKGIKTAIPCLIQFILENISLYKISIYDKELDIYNSHYLKLFMQNIISHILDGVKDIENNTSSFYTSIYLLLIRLDRPENISAHLYKVLFTDIISRLTTKYSPWPIFSYSHRIVAIVLHNVTIKKARQVLEDVWQTLNNKKFIHPLSKSELKCEFSIGMSCFPRDFNVLELKESPEFLSFGLQERALLALEKSSIFREPFYFTKIYLSGARITELLPLNRVRIDIGRNSGVDKGYRFFILEGLSLNSKLKGEVVVDKVAHCWSEGKILFSQSPYVAPTKGDRLKLNSKYQTKGLDIKYWPESKLLQKAKKVYQEKGKVVLALVQLQKNDELFKTVCKDIIQFVKQKFMSFYVKLLSQNILGFIFPETSLRVKDEFLSIERIIWENYKNYFYLGLAYLPFYSFKTQDLYENAQKALLHAHYFRKRPFVAVFDSISLTINGDRLFNEDNYYEAVKEYQSALALDPNNIFALNSLGIIYARLGEFTKAKKMFSQTLEIDAENDFALYNLARTLDKEGDFQLAKKYYLQCKTPRYRGYGLLWIGYYWEKQRKYKQAEQYYLKAKEILLNESQPDTFLANLYLKQNELEQANKHLHMALTKNPNDAWALNLLARLYLKQDQDPELAEVLARHSVSLRPEIPEFWKTLHEINNKT